MPAKRDTDPHAAAVSGSRIMYAHGRGFSLGLVLGLPGGALIAGAIGYSMRDAEIKGLAYTILGFSLGAAVAAIFARIRNEANSNP